MPSDDLLLLRGVDIDTLLAQQEARILEAVRRAYQAHAHGLTAMPPDSYLRFPGMEKERIISKVAFIGDDAPVAGIKWIASFPGNLSKGIERASATLILNSVDTGRPQVVMESSIISAKRTAASAALGASLLLRQETLEEVGLVGCGYINFETLRFLLHQFPDIRRVHLCDLQAPRAQQFAERAQALKPDLEFAFTDDSSAIITQNTVSAFATTAVKPHIDSVAGHPEGAVFLHTSLRDFKPAVMLEADNVVDDIEKACSNQTSLHLAELEAGHRAFVRTDIGTILNGEAASQDLSRPYAMFSPFGLGILDMAVAQVVYELAQEAEVGTVIPSFLPPSWLER